MHQALAVSLSRALMALDAGEALTPASLPSGPRAALVTRRAALRTALAPAGPERTKAVLLSIANMAMKNEPAREIATALVRQDIADLADLPAFALEAAARAYRLAEIGTGEWRPTAGMIRAEAVKRLEAYARELGRIGRVLDAPLMLEAPKPATPEQRERVLAGLRDLTARMGG